MIVTNNNILFWPLDYTFDSFVHLLEWIFKIVNLIVKRKKNNRVTLTYTLKIILKIYRYNVCQMRRTFHSNYNNITCIASKRLDF